MSKIWLPLTVVVWAFSRFLLFLNFGVRFDAATLAPYRQYVDIALLRDRLIESVWYLHSQPPLFNLFLGAVLKIFPNDYLTAFSVIYLGASLLLTLSIFFLLSRLGLSGALSAILTSAFMISPEVILYENWLLYEFPLAVLLVLSALFLHRFVEKERMLDARLLAWTLLAISLVRSAFHIVWFTACLLALLIVLNRNRRAVMIAFRVPLVLLSLVYFKNLCLFQTFSTGAIYPAFNQVTVLVPACARDAVCFSDLKKSLPRITHIPPFSELKDYAAFVPRPQASGIPVLDQDLKSTGQINFHHRGYLEVAKQYQTVVSWLWRNYPLLCLRALSDVSLLYFLPASDVWPFDVGYPNFDSIGRYHELVSRNLLIQRAPHQMAFALLVGLPVLFLVAGFLLRKSGRAFQITVTFMLGNVFFAYVLGFATWEPQRMRFATDPFYLAFAAIGLAYSLRGIKVAPQPVSNSTQSLVNNIRQD